MQANIGWIKREGSCFDKLPNGTRVFVRMLNPMQIESFLISSPQHHIYNGHVVAWRPVGAIKWPVKEN